MKFHTRARRMPQVMIVSLIDIFAILLIFVIVTTTFKTPTQPSFAIKLPESKTAVSTETPAEPVILSISEDDRIALDDVETPITHLRLALIEKMKNSGNRQ